MKVTKSLLLGAAAGFVAVSGAQAADLPVKAKAVEYVKICSAYGAGFYYIPGTDICLRVGGRVRADYFHNMNPASNFPDISSENDRSEETHGIRGRGYLTMDARNQTAYGTLRAYVNGYSSWTTAASGLGASASAFGWDRAYIQWAGFTFGQAQSFFDFHSPASYGNAVLWEDPTTGATGWNVLAYTAQFGNGVSATLSIEDQRRRAIVGGDSSGNTSPSFTEIGTGLGNRAGQNLPALVANLRVDQSWGSAQIMAAVQELRTNDSVLPHLDTYGYAVGGGFTWNNPAAPGSQFGIQATWAVGATGYALSTYTRHRILDGGSPPPVSQGGLADGVVLGGSLHKTEAWSVISAYQHRFNPQWAWSVYGGYAAVNYASAVNNSVECVDAGSRDCDFSFWSIGSRINWTPVSGLELGLDVIYNKFGTQRLTPSDVGGGINRSNDVVSAMFRVQRTW